MNPTTVPQRRSKAIRTASFDASTELLRHLCSVRKVDAYADVVTVGEALDHILRPEFEQFNDLMWADHIYPGAAAELVANFVDSARDVMIAKKPRSARAAIAKLLGAVETEMRERIVAALRQRGSAPIETGQGAVVSESAVEEESETSGVPFTADLTMAVAESIARGARDAGLEIDWTRDPLDDWEEAVRSKMLELTVDENKAHGFAAVYRELHDLAGLLHDDDDIYHLASDIRTKIEHWRAAWDEDAELRRQAKIDRLRDAAIAELDDWIA
jgi:hypothetical protein